MINKTPRCNCPDALKGNHCKHLLFIFKKVCTSMLSLIRSILNPFSPPGFPSLVVLLPKVHPHTPSPYPQLISAISLPKALLTTELKTIFAEELLIPNDVMNLQIRDNIY